MASERKTAERPPQTVKAHLGSDGVAAVVVVEGTRAPVPPRMALLVHLKALR
jgi:hypothetical protein